MVNGFWVLSLKFGGNTQKFAESGLLGLYLFGCMRSPPTLLPFL